MVNFSENLNKLEEYDSDQRSKPGRQSGKKIKRFLRLFVYLAIFCLMSFAIFSLKISTSDQTGESWIYRLPIISQIKHLAESADKELKGEDRDRINILLLGMGGKNHDGGYLTDTIILASLEPSTKKISLLSIPRDLTIPMSDAGLSRISGDSWRKVHNINAYAEVDSPGSGGLAISQALSDVLQTPIDYFLRMDFDGFINIIDELGGVKIDVDNTLEDFKYPIMGQEEAEPYEARFEHLYIPAGEQKMDGSLALKYVRSRHGAGVEGSDFARARRQQKVILAVKDELLSKYILFKPRMVTNIINELQEHLSTNIKIWEILKLWDMFGDLKKEDIVNNVLDNSPSGLLVDYITPEGAYVLIPRSGDFAEIQYLVNNIFSDAPFEAKTKVATENASIEVRNGTWINGLASKTALDLEKYGFNVIRIGNSSRQNFEKSVIYDLTYGEKIKSLTVLKEKIGANVSFVLPEWLVGDIENELKSELNPLMPDFILILGQNADTTASGAANIEE